MIHGSLRLLPKSFDPPIVGDEGSGKVASQVYEGLLGYHPYARPYQLMPVLAEAMPEVSEDGLSYTFRMRTGVVFQDDPCFEGGKGREVTAHDLLYVLKRFAHPETRSTGWWLFDGKIRGLNAWRDGRRADVLRAAESGQPYDPLLGLDESVEGLEVVDDYTFRFHLTKPYPQFLWTLAMSYTSLYPHEAVSMYGETFGVHPVGTGPFRVREFNPVYRVVYEANPTYRDVRVPDPANEPSDRWDGWEADRDAGFLKHAGERIPLVDGMEIRFILEDQPRWLYFANGHTDWLNPPKDNVRDALPNGELSNELRERGLSVQRVTELGTVYLAMNTNDPLFQNVDLRRAIALAIDHGWTVENLYGGQAIIAKSLIPPGVAGYQEQAHPYKTNSGTSDLARAREYMVKAGYPDGIDPETGKALRIVYDNSGSGVTQRMFASRFTDEMRRLGIEVDLIVNTFPQLTKKMRKQNYQVTGLAWGFDYPDAQNILQLLYGPNESPGINGTNFSNAEFDALYEQAMVLPDGPERTRLYEQMAYIVADQVPMVTRTHRIRQNLQQPWVEGYKFTEVHYQNWRYMAIDKAMRDTLVEGWNQPTRWPLFVLFGVCFLGVALTYREAA